MTGWIVALRVFQAANVVEPIARDAGYNILLCNARSPEDEQQAVSVLLEKQVDGIIFLSNSLYMDDDYLPQLQPSAPPIVLINRATIYEGFEHINWDNASVTKMLVKYLSELGHRRIAHLRGPANRRAAGRAALGTHLVRGPSGYGAAAGPNFWPGAVVRHERWRAAGGRRHAGCRSAASIGWAALAAQRDSRL